MTSSADVEGQIEKYRHRLTSHDTEKVSHALKRLSQLEVSVDLLTRTGIGKVVNKLRHDDTVGDRAKKLVNKWKDLVNQSNSNDPSENEDTNTPCGRDKGHKQEEHHSSRENGRQNKSDNDKTSRKSDRKRKLEINGHAERKTHVSSTKKREEKAEKLSKSTKKCDPNDDKDIGISCDTGLSFMDVLSMGDDAKTKMVAKSKPAKPAKIKSNSSLPMPVPLPPRTSSPPALNDIDWKKILPSINPAEYKPRTSSEIIIGQQFMTQAAKKKGAQMDAIDDSSFSRKKDRTQVFAGRGGSGLKSVPTLFDACIRVICDNVDAIEDTGCIPFEILKPALERASPAQLFYIEKHNEYLIDDTEGLWEGHCKSLARDSKLKQEQTWRQLYQELIRDRDDKLKSLAAKVSHNKATVKNGQRVAKLAVDVVPREVRRKQAKYGTYSKSVATADEIVAARRMIDEAKHNKPVVPIKKTSIYRPASEIEKPHYVDVKRKPKVAPGMAKSLKLFAKTKTRR